MFKGVGLFLIALFSVQISWAQTSADDVITVDDNNSAEEISIKVDEPQETATETPSNKHIEKINVTGSHIKRIDVEGPSPIVTIDSEMFDVTGVNTVTDLVRESPLFERAGDGGYFRFHGQHAGNTLVLLNGMRVPKLGAPGSDFYNGIQGIPTNVLERVDILKDGSSATYGSDAIAGVVNFVTKKDYDGVEFSSRVTVPEIGAGIEQNYSMAFGKNYNRGSWFTSVQYVNRSSVTEDDIGSFYRGDSSLNASASSATFRPTNGGKKAEFRPSCNGGKCDNVGDLSKDLHRSDSENIGALVTGRYDVSSMMNVAILGMYNRQYSNSYGNPNRFNFNEAQGGGPLNRNNIGSELASKLNSADGLENAEINPIEELGFSERNTVADTFSVQSKVEGYYADTWNWQLQGSYANMVQTTQHTNGIADLDEVRGLMQQGLYDPSQASGQRGSLDSARVTPQEQYVSDLTMARLVTSGEMFEMGGGPVAIAVGAEAQFETVGDRNDAIFFTGNLSNPLTANQNGERQIQSGFVELTAYPIENLELQLAARYDNYSDFGDITNPKVAMSYRPSKRAMFRASWGTNFKAPSIRNMIFQQDQGFERFYDAGCDRNAQRCSSQFYPTTRYKDPNIGPEKGQHYNIGTVVQPNKNWTFTIDQWNFEGTDTIAKLYGSRYTEYEKLIGEDGLADMGVFIERDPTDNKILSFRAPEIVNLGERTIRGLDFKIDFSSKMSIFGLPMNGGAIFDHSHFLVYKTKRFTAVPWESREDLEWKNTTSLFLATTKNYYRLAARTVAGGNDNHSSGAEIPTHTEYDFTYSYTSSWGGKFSVGVKNLLDSSIPNDKLASTSFIRASGSRDFDAFNPLGRRYFMGYGQTF